MSELKRTPAEASNGWWYVEAEQSRLNRACKAASLGVVSIVVTVWALTTIRQELIAAETDTVAEVPASAEDMIHSLIRDSMYGEGQVNVLSGAVAVQQMSDSEGIRERSITDPIWLSVDGTDYFAGKNPLSRDGDNLIIWQTGSDVRLCASADDQAHIEPTQLGVGIDFTGFAENVGVFRNHTKYPVKDLCQVSTDIPDLVSRTKV